MQAIAAAPLEEIVVTATRRPEPALHVPLSIGQVGPETIQLVDPTHHAELLNRIAGVMIQRGSGQESLTAIRSPVLTGAGSCGAFLFLENGVPIRPVGFCNVNALYEVNTEQARAIEVLRGPGSALYGSSAMHGTVNVLQPSAAERPRGAFSVDGGPSNYWRLKAAGRADWGATALGLAGLYANDGGWRAVSGYHETKVNAALTSRWDATPVRFDLAATVARPADGRLHHRQGRVREPAAEQVEPDAGRRARLHRSAADGPDRAAACRWTAARTAPVPAHFADGIPAALPARPAGRAQRPGQRRAADEPGVGCSRGAVGHHRRRPGVRQLVAGRGPGKPDHRRITAGERDPPRRQALRL